MSKENRNNTILGLIAVLLFAAIGFVISTFIGDILTDQAAGASGILKDILDALTQPGLLQGILWMVISVIVYFGVGMAFPDGAKVGVFSPLLYILWLFVNLGLVIGFIIWFLIQGGSVTLDLDQIVNSIYGNLVTSLGPTFAAALGIVNKLGYRN